MLWAIACLVGVVGLVQWRAATNETRAEAAHPPDGQIIEVDGVPVHMFVSGTGPDLVLLHGASGNLSDFTFNLVDQLKDRYRIITFDRPGLGWTGRLRNSRGAWNAHGESPAAQAALLRTAAETVGITSPIVLGHSYGGTLALAWALDAPDNTGAAVLVGSVTNPWPGELSLLHRINGSAPGSALVVPFITAFTPRSTIENTTREIFEPQPMPDGYLDHIGPGLTMRRASLRANSQQVNSLRPHIVEMSARYGDLTLPVELIHGTADTIVPQVIHAEEFIKMVPSANLTSLPGVGHMPQHSHADDVIAAIDRAAARAGLR